MEGFGLDKEQLKKVNDWVAGHAKRYGGAIGGRYTYTFTPTSLGTVSKVIDNITKEELDVTDYEGW
jgi:hypothetical protein